MTRLEKIKIFAFAVLLLLPFALCACGEGELLKTVTDGDRSFELYGKEESLRYVVVIKDGKRLGKYKVGGERASEEADFGFELTDLNFDGITDFRVIISSGAELTYYASYIGNSDGTYYASKELSELANLSSDSESKTLHGETYKKQWEGKDSRGEYAFYVERWGEHTYQWSGGLLRELERLETVYYSETDMYCIVHYAADGNGNLEISEETWIEGSEFRN